MPRSFNIQALRDKLPKSLPELGRDPRMVMRAILGALLVANLVAAAILFKPWAGSTEDLEQQAAGLRQQVRQRTTELARLKSLVSKVETARAQGDQFETRYFMENRTVSEVILAELEKASRESGIHMKEATFGWEPVEGTDDLTMMTINTSFEGTFADLMQFVNAMDRSPRFLIVDSLQASPQQSGLALNVIMKMNGFVRERSPEASASTDTSGQNRAEVAQAR